MNVTISELDKMLFQGFVKDKPSMIYGSMGIGKSHTVEAVARRYAQHLGKEFMDWNRMSSDDKAKTTESTDLSSIMFFIDMRMSQKDPSDITGIPFISNDHMKWFPPSVIKVLSHPTCSAVLFFDELTDASTPVMKAAYQLVHDRCAGEVSFSPNVRIVAAGNGSNHRCNVNETPLALDNRFRNFILLPPTAEEWCKWAENNGVDNRVISFIRYRPSDLCIPVNKITEKAFPTPRSITALSDMITGTEDKDYAVLEAACNCGTGFSLEFGSFLDNANDVDPEKIFNNPSLFNGLSLGAKWFATGSLSSYYSSKRTTLSDKTVGVLDNKAIALLKVIDQDYAYVMIRLFQKSNKLFLNKLLATNDSTLVNMMTMLSSVG